MAESFLGRQRHQAQDRGQETENRLVPIEVRLSATPRRSMAAGIRALNRDLGGRVSRGYVVHPGDVRLPLGTEAIALPFADL